MKAKALILAALLSGCASQFQMNSGSLGVNVQSHTSVGALLTIGLLSATVYAENADEGAGYRPNPFFGMRSDSSRSAPPMDASRKVNEQDCSKPIVDWSANLRCR